MTVHEVSRRTGVSVRALHHYDLIGLLPPTKVTQAGYRLYDEAALERLQQILLFRELEFPLRDIATILDSPDFDREKALQQQITLLEMRQEHIARLLTLARDMQQTGGRLMPFDAFDRRKMDDYARQARETWGQTEAYREYEQRSAGRGPDREQALGEGLMQVLAVFHDLRDQPDDAPAVTAQVEALQAYITQHWYTCTKEILARLGRMYGAGGEMAENIDRCGGEGTAAFASRAIARYCADK
jgi:DNA-binding transcriptional MerR regulator